MEQIDLFKEKKPENKEVQISEAAGCAIDEFFQDENVFQENLQKALNEYPNRMPLPNELMKRSLAFHIQEKYPEGFNREKILKELEKNKNQIREKLWSGYLRVFKKCEKNMDSEKQPENFEKKFNVKNKPDFKKEKSSWGYSDKRMKAAGE